MPKVISMELDVVGLVLIPLYNRHGEVVALASVDERDAGCVGRHRWTRTHQGYAGRTVHGKKVILMHRQIMVLRFGDARQVDHKNHDRLDNRRSNLRLVTPVEQAQNTGPRAGVSRYRGVWWSKQKSCWAAEAKLGGIKHHIGLFADEREAGLAAYAFRCQHMPFAIEEVPA